MDKGPEAQGGMRGPRRTLLAGHTSPWRVPGDFIVIIHVFMDLARLEIELCGGWHKGREKNSRSAFWGVRGKLAGGYAQLTTAPYKLVWRSRGDPHWRNEEPKERAFLVIGEATVGKRI